MSEYTREEILKLIEENGGPERLDLSGKDLSGIDLSTEVIAAERVKAAQKEPLATPVWFSETTWSICLHGVFLQGTNLQGANLGSANLQEAHLGGANLQRAYLLGANLQEAYLGSASLQAANLELANLQRAELGYTNLQEAKLMGADLQEARLWHADLQRAELMNANLQGAELEWANLQGASLWNANLQGASLWNANLQRASLLCANLQGTDPFDANLQGANLVYSHLEKLDLFVAKSLKGAYFYNAFLDDTRLKREQLGEAIGEELEEKYYRAKEAYVALKNNFAEIGRYRDESWAYIKERQMGKMCSAPWRARRFYGKSHLGDSEESKSPTWHPRVWWFYARHTWKWFWDWVAEETCEFGESIFRTLGTMAVALVGFAVLYWLLGAVVDTSGNPVNSWLQCLLYSGGAFTTFGVDALRPANDWIRALSIFESGVGIALTGLLGFVLGNRIRRS